jgi:O-succinylbenzoic acid--CoA ligase
MDLTKSSHSIDDLKLCRAILVGGAGYSSELLQMVRQNLLPVSFTYGSSETGAQVAATRPGMHPSGDKVAGQILPGRQLRIDHDGHIQIKDAGLMLGYWLDKDFYALDQDERWYTSSDLGRIEGGELTVLGRSDDVYMVGGEGVSLSEVQLLLDHGKWQGRMYAVMLEDQRLGFAPCAVIESAQRPQIKRLLQQLEEYLPSLKRPRSVYWHQVNSLTAGEKPNRSILKAGVLDGSFECLWRRSESD